MNKKILIIGHARHGKDTLAEFIYEKIGMSYRSSSMACAEFFIYEKLKDKYNYTNVLDCFDDRINHRIEWYDMIRYYNHLDEARLAKEILKKYDMYVGMRSNSELQECINQHIFDIIVGVYDPSKPEENIESFDINMWNSCDYIIMNNSTLDILKKRANIFCTILQDN